MLVHETGETAVVVRRIGLSSVCLHQVESDEAFRVTLEPGEMSPLYAGAPGRVLLAFAPAEVLEEVLAQDLVRITDVTPTEDELRASLGAIVMTGMATSEGELIEGSVAMAVPVFREDGIVGAIALIGPAFRCGRRGGRGPAGCSRRRPARSTRRWRRTGPPRPVLLSRIVADDRLMAWQSGEVFAMLHRNEPSIAVTSIVWPRSRPVREPAGG